MIPHNENDTNHVPEFPESERLGWAFLKLAQRGWVARHHFWCCQGCGLYAMNDFEKRGNRYVFYHEQDSEHAARDGWLHLRFGPMKDNSPHAARWAAGMYLAAHLIKEGFEIKWNGDPDHTIEVYVGECPGLLEVECEGCGYHYMPEKLNDNGYCEQCEMDDQEEEEQCDFCGDWYPVDDLDMNGNCPDCADDLENWDEDDDDETL